MFDVGRHSLDPQFRGSTCNHVILHPPHEVLRLHSASTTTIGNKWEIQTQPEVDVSRVLKTHSHKAILVPCLARNVDTRMAGLAPMNSLTQTSPVLHMARMITTIIERLVPIKSYPAQRLTDKAMEIKHTENHPRETGPPKRPAIKVMEEINIDNQALVILEEGMAAKDQDRALRKTPTPECPNTQTPNRKGDSIHLKLALKEQKDKQQTTLSDYFTRPLQQPKALVSETKDPWQ